MTVEQVIAAARQLSPDEWAEVVASVHPLVVTDAFRAELDRRWAEYESDPTNVITLEQFKADRASRR